MNDIVIHHKKLIKEYNKSSTLKTPRVSCGVFFCHALHNAVS